jgi:hypothetical protein
VYSDAQLRAFARVRDLISDVLESRAIRYREVVGVTPWMLTRATRKGNLRIATLVHIAEALGYEVVINFRELAPPVQKDGADGKRA